MGTTYATNSDLVFATRDGATSVTEKMRILGNGNVGIGLTNPSWQLEVQNTGTVRHAISSTTNGTAGVFFRVFNSGTQVGNGTIATQNNGDMKFFNGTSSESEKMRIRASGTVGIGAAGFDSQMLTIAAGALDGAIYATSTDANCFASFRDNSSSANIEYGARGNDHVLRKDGTDYFVVNNVGDVYNFKSVQTANTFYGYAAGDYSSSSSGNTFMGYNVGNNLTSGSNNTGMGRDVFISTLTGDANTAVGTGAGRLLGSGSRNSLFGDGAGDKLANASDNIAIGYEALFTNVGSGQNVAIGVNAARAFTGSRLVAIGTDAAKALSSDVDNVFIGQQAGEKRTAGTDNTFIGAYANYNGAATGVGNTGVGKSTGYSLTSGASNTLFGKQSGYSITDGADNTMVGHNTGIFVTGSGNTYMGSYAGDASSSSGSYNTGIGRAGLSAVTSGTYHTALGYNAGDEITTGTNCIAIGHAAGSGSSPRHMTTNSNEIVIGNNSIVGAYVRVAWTTGSDKRDKINFSDVPHGLDFVNKLKPTSYDLRKERDSDETIGERKYGFIAQEILELEGDNPVIIDNSDENKLALQDSNLIPILVNAIKELKAEIDELKK
jgi:hypothetical protein